MLGRRVPMRTHTSDKSPPTVSVGIRRGRKWLYEDPDPREVAAPSSAPLKTVAEVGMGPGLLTGS